MKDMVAVIVVLLLGAMILELFSRILEHLLYP